MRKTGIVQDRSSTYSRSEVRTQYQLRATLSHLLRDILLGETHTVEPPNVRHPYVFRELLGRPCAGGRSRTMGLHCSGSTSVSGPVSAVVPSDDRDRSTAI